MDFCNRVKRLRVFADGGTADVVAKQLLARPMLRGVAQLQYKFTLTMAAYGLIRLPLSVNLNRTRNPAQGRASPAAASN